MKWIVGKKIFHPSSGDERSDLTPGKAYDVYIDTSIVVNSSDGIYWILKNDLGEKIHLHESYMIDLSDFRNSKLDDLGI